MITHAHWLAPFSVHKMGCSFYQKKEEEHPTLYEGCSLLRFNNKNESLWLAWWN